MKEEYRIASDEELILRLRDGEAEIIDYIMEKYKDLVRSKARRMHILGADNEDLIQEGMIGLFKAVRDYDFGRDAGFFTFADLCVSRQMYNAVQGSCRKKHAPLNFYISLYSRVGSGEGGEGEEAELQHLLTAPGESSPEEMMIDRENVLRLEQIMEQELSAFEKQVMDLYVTGMRGGEIGRILGRDEKSVDNALQRLRGKLKKILSDVS